MSEVDIKLTSKVNTDNLQDTSSLYTPTSHKLTDMCVSFFIFFIFVYKRVRLIIYSSFLQQVEFRTKGSKVGLHEQRIFLTKYVKIKPIKKLEFRLNKSLLY